MGLLAEVQGIAGRLNVAYVQGFCWEGPELCLLDGLLSRVSIRFSLEMAG